MGTPTGIELIAAERQRQIEVEDWSSENDDGHTHGELAMAAASYIVYSVHPDDKLALDIWPWSFSHFKPKNMASNLVRAGALIAAEIDRLQRAAKED